MVAAALSSIALMLTAIGGAFAHAEFSVDEALVRRYIMND